MQHMRLKEACWTHDSAQTLLIGMPVEHRTAEVSSFESKGRGSDSNLVVAGASGVQLAADSTDNFTEAALIRGVDVLIARHDPEGPRPPLLRDAVQAVHQRRRLLRRQHARLRQRLRVRLAALHEQPRPL